MLTVYSQSPIDPVARDILSRAKTLANLSEKIQLTTDETVALRATNLLTLGRYTQLHGLPTLSTAQIKSKANSLTTLKRALVMCHQQTSPPFLKWSPPTPKSRKSMSPETPTLRIFSSRQETILWLASRIGSKSSRTDLVLDIETHGDIDILHPAERPLVYVGLFDGSEAAIIPAELLTSAWVELLDYLKRFNLIAHNGKFDLVTLCSQLGDPKISLKLTWDTMLMHYALWPASEQGLKVVAKQMLGVDDWEKLDSYAPLTAVLFDDRRTWWSTAYPVMEQLAEDKDLRSGMDMKRLGDYPPSMVQLYNAYDVYYTWLLWEQVKPVLDNNEDAAKAYRHLIRFSNHIQVDEADGFPVDLDKARKLADPYTEAVEQHLATLQEWAHAHVDASEFPGGAFNPNSPKQIQKLYATLGVELTKTDKKVMTELAQKGDKFAAKMLEYRSAKKMLSTYLDRVITHHNTIHGEPRMYPWYNLTSTVTGRLSSSGGTNIQNWPKQEELDHHMRLRGVYVPSRFDRWGVPQQRTLVQVDYSQAELRVAAALSGDDWLTGIFSDPSVDIFTQMTLDIFPNIGDKDQIKLWRRPLKSVVYGLMFGRGAEAVALELGIPIPQAKMIMNKFLTMADDLDRWRHWIMRACVVGEPIVTRFGRHFQHEVVTNKNKGSVRRSALSFLPQSTASDIMLTAYMGMKDWMATQPQLDWRFRALVHDAVTWDTPADEVEQCAEITTKFMVAAAKKIIPEVPFAVDANWANNWSETG